MPPLTSPGGISWGRGAFYGPQNPTDQKPGEGQLLVVPGGRRSRRAAGPATTAPARSPSLVLPAAPRSLGVFQANKTDLQNLQEPTQSSFPQVLPGVRGSVPHQHNAATQRKASAPSAVAPEASLLLKTDRNGSLPPPDTSKELKSALRLMRRGTLWSRSWPQPQLHIRESRGKEKERRNRSEVKPQQNGKTSTGS